MTRHLFSAYAAVLLLAGSASAQQKATITGVPEIPFTSVANFLKLPAGEYLGESVAVATNSKGNIFVYHRRDTTRLFEFDKNGTFIKEIGKGYYGFEFAHSVRVDKDDNIWTVDEGTNLVTKFSPDGKVLMTLGKPGVRGNPPDALTDPNDVATDPDNGDIYVAESHSNVEDPNLVGRISVFDRNGKFLKCSARRRHHFLENRLGLSRAVATSQASWGFEPWLSGVTPEYHNHSARAPRDLLSAQSESRSRMTRHVEGRHRTVLAHG
jgi:DNA-binding beta-propeller fold protein YncE